MIKSARNAAWAAGEPANAANGLLSARRLLAPIRNCSHWSWARTAASILVLFAPLTTPLPAESAERAAEASAVERILAGDVPETVDDLKAMQDRLQQLSEQLMPYTVALRVGPAQGSGVIISGDGFVLTAAHVATRPGRRIALTLSDGSQVRAESLGMNRNVDAGLAKILDPPPEGQSAWPHAEWGSTEHLKPGQWCLAMGHPGGYQSNRPPVLRLGRVLSLRDSVVVTDCTLIGGDSGGPLFSLDGKLLGIHSRISGPLTVNMHVPVEEFRTSWERMAAREAWGHLPGEEPFLGVLGTKDPNEARIEKVYPGTPAERAGLQPGDVILRFDGELLKDFDALIEQVQNHAPGDRVTLEISRDGQRMPIELIVGQRGG